jgi:hypothetical protein
VVVGIGSNPPPLSNTRLSSPLWKVDALPIAGMVGGGGGRGAVSVTAKSVVFCAYSFSWRGINRNCSFKSFIFVLFCNRGAVYMVFLLLVPILILMFAYI